MIRVNRGQVCPLFMLFTVSLVFAANLAFGTVPCNKLAFLKCYKLRSQIRIAYIFNDAKYDIIIDITIF